MFDLLDRSFGLLRCVSMNRVTRLLLISPIVLVVKVE